jgi:hypothetical protein
MWVVKKNPFFLLFILGTLSNLASYLMDCFSESRKKKIVMYELDVFTTALCFEFCYYLFWVL